MKVKLGNQTLVNAAKFKGGKKFTIIIKDSSIDVNEFFITCFSDKIKLIIESHPNTKNYAIKTEINDSTVNIIKRVLKTGFFEDDIELRIAEELYYVGIELGNNDITEPYISYIESLEFSSKNIIDRLSVLAKMMETSKMSETSNKLSENIKYVVQHFYEIDHQKLIDFLSSPYFDIAEQIITDTDLVVNTEDEIANFLVDLSEKNECFTSLLSHIYLHYCSKDVYTRVVNRLELVLEGHEDNQILFDFLKKYDPEEKAYPRKVYDKNKSPKSKFQMFELLNKQNEECLEIIGHKSQEINKLQRENNKLKNNSPIKKLSISILNEFPQENANFETIYCILNGFAKSDNIEGLKYAVQNSYELVQNENDETILQYAQRVENTKLWEMLEECRLHRNALDLSGRNIMRKISKAADIGKNFVKKSSGFIKKLWH